MHQIRTSPLDRIQTGNFGPLGKNKKMSSLTCKNCGHVMKDVQESHSDNYFGTIVKNGDFNKALTKAAEVLAEITEAHKENILKEKVEELCPVYTDQPIKEIFDDILTSMVYLEVGLCYAACTKCGTILIQNEKESQYYSAYIPEEENECKDLTSK